VRLRNVGRDPRGGRDLNVDLYLTKKKKIGKEKIYNRRNKKSKKLPKKANSLLRGKAGDGKNRTLATANRKRGPAGSAAKGACPSWKKKANGLQARGEGTKPRGGGQGEF